MGWGRATRQLRDLLLPCGWRKDDPGNFSMTINDKRRMYVVVATGDGFTGRQGDDPRTKTPVFGRRREVGANRQLDLFPELIPETIRMRPETAGYTAWYLLIDLSAEKIFVELSRPLEMMSGKIAIWAERIIFPPIDPAPAAVMVVPTDFGPDFEPDVRRIG
jgi:hypothetical protein